LDRNSFQTVQLTHINFRRGVHWPRQSHDIDTGQGETDWPKDQSTNRTDPADQICVEKKNAPKEPPRLGVKNHLQRGSDSSNKFYQWSRCKVDDKTHTGNPTAETMSGVRTGIGRHKNKTTRKLHWSGHRRLIHL